MESNWRSCRCLQVVSIHKFWVYKVISRPGVNKSFEWDFIKVILTKDQGRSKRDKKQIRVRKSKYIESDRTYYCIGKFNMALSLCRALEVNLYFSEGFLEAAIGESAVVKAPQLLRVTVVCFLEQKSNLWSSALQ